MVDKYTELKMWCQKVIPLVYDDSLSYYEFLCKVLKKLNDLGITFNEFLSYIKSELDLRPTYEFINNNMKLSNEGDFTGSWFGIKRPTQSQEGLAGAVEQILDEYLPNINKRLNQIVVNVKNYGAVGDGVQDDTMAIQKAINDVKENGTLFIPDGIYMIKGALDDNDTYSEDIVRNSVLGLKLHSNMNVVLESKSTILKMLPNNASTCTILNIQGCENIKIIGGVIDGNKNYQVLHDYTTPPGQIGGYWNDQWRSGALVYGENENVEFFGVDFVNHVGDGIMCHTFDTNKLPVNILVNSCVFNKCGRTGVHVGGGKNYVVVNCKFYNIVKTNTNVCQISNIGVDIEANWIYLEQVMVDNCIFDNVENGVLANYCKKNITVSNCNFDNSIYHDMECREGIEQINVINNVMYGSLNIFSDNVIAKNNIINKLYFYANVSGSKKIKNVLIKNNLVKQTTIWGSFAGDNFIIEDNIFNYLNDVPTGKRTLTVNSATICNVIFKNNIFNSSPSGNVFVTGDPTNDENTITFVGNIFNGNAVFIDGTESQIYNYKNALFKDNVFKNLNGGTGVRIYTTVYIVFDDNEIIYDNLLLENNVNKITVVRLETAKCNSLNSKFMSFLNTQINRGMYLVNINQGVSTDCLAHNNVFQPTKFSTPLGYYNFTNYASANNLM